MRYKSYKVIDDWTGQSLFGDGDGYLDPGEKDELSITLKNLGSVDAYGVTATLVFNPKPGDPINPYITVLKNSANFGDIAALSEATGLDTFLIQVGPECPDGYLASFTLIIEDLERHSWQENFDIVVTKNELIIEFGRETKNADSPQIASDGDGHVYMVWSDYRNGNPHIYFNYSSDHGAIWQANDIRLDTNAVGAAWPFFPRPKISSDNNGNVDVVWEDWRNGKSDIYFNYSRDYGATWRASDIRLDTNAPGAADSYYPQISSDNNGNVYIVWTDRRNGKSDIYFNYSRDYGAIWQASDIRLDTDSPGSEVSISPQIVSDGDGRVYVVWVDDRNNY
ncbi:MAG: hypothetical protein Q8R48_01905, partial [Candidatus Omnitrophota bacterium]|nr:hypothetical protein [Candidatus Omnitrophota bacterium]